MSTNGLSKEERILEMMRKVLAGIVKDTTTPPGMKHPLSDHSIADIRDCLALISARENELAKAAGRPRTQRPHYVDETHRANVVPLHKLTGKKDPDK